MKIAEKYDKNNFSTHPRTKDKLDSHKVFQTDERVNFKTFGFLII